MESDMWFEFPYFDEARNKQSIIVEADEFGDALLLAVEELHRRDPA
jgi:hypothetical protein